MLGQTVLGGVDLLTLVAGELLAEPRYRVGYAGDVFKLSA